MMTDKQKLESDFRVGLLTFLAFTLIIFGVAFAGGDKGLFLKKTSELSAWLPDVKGLKKGSAVTMGGLTIGKVTNIDFASGTDHPYVQVDMIIRTDVLRRIKQDSVPSVKTQGMMGDRYVDISNGSPEAAPLTPGTPLKGEPAVEFDETLKRASSVLTQTEKILSAVNGQKGTVGNFFYDPQFYDNLMHLTEEAHELIRDFKENPKKYVKLSLF